MIQDEPRPSKRPRTAHIAAGRSAPYPVPSSDAASRIGQGNRRSDTKPELVVRRLLHGRGLRFRVDHPIRAGLQRAIKVDIAFTRARLAVFIDGCFWHACPDHGSMPKSNADYWAPKLQANMDRDIRQARALHEVGWEVLRAWEHEPAVDVADRIESAYWRLVDGRPHAK